MLDPRAQTLLKTLVERYIVEGQPVGSRVLSKQPGLELSPATIRNVMADLEELGYIASPHTSAGRIPTPKGYRFFVDSLMVMKPLEQVEIHRLEGEFTADRPQQLMSAAASLLSQLTHFAGVVMTPKRREPAVPPHRIPAPVRPARAAHHRHVRGDVQNRILHTDRSYSQSQLIEATNFFNQHYSPASPIAAVRSLLAEELKSLREDIVGLMTAAVEVGGAALQQKRGARRHRREEPAGGARPRVEHGSAAPAVRALRAEDLAPASARRLAARRGRADLHRRRVGPGPARRDAASSPRRTSSTAASSARSASSARRGWPTSA